MRKHIKFVALLAVGPCLAGCQFSGGTALPDPSEVRIETPSGYTMYTNSKLATSLKVKDGDKVVEFTMRSDPDKVIQAQAELAPALAPLAEIHKAQTESLLAFFAPLRDAMLAAIPLPAPVTP